MLDQLGEIQTKLAKNCYYETCGNRVGIVCSGDAGWQGGGSRNTYNSISGHTLLVGGYTKLVLAFKFFSKLCQTCNTFEKKNGTDLNDTAYPKHRCARNWSESSKAMELRGIVECATLIWDTGKAWMRVFVSDDDSSSHAALRHNILDKTTVHPQDSKGKLLKSTGKLPACVKEPKRFLVDPSHCHRVYGSHLFRLIAHCHAFKKTDCEVLIRNFGYAVKQNCGKTMPEFEKGMNAANNHQFNDHQS